MSWLGAAIPVPGIIAIVERLPKFWLMLVGRYPFSEFGEASSREVRWSSPSYSSSSPL